METEMKLINVRGCNGSGKTTVVREVMGGELSCVLKYPIPDHKDIPVTFNNTGLLAAIGDYEKGGCSGLDRIKTQAATKRIIELIVANPTVLGVLFEGVMVSTIFEPWLEWSRKMGGMTWAFLDTPIDVCLSRVQARNGGTPVKEEQIRAKHAGIQRIRVKARAAGERVIDLPWRKARETLLEEILSPSLRNAQPGGMGVDKELSKQIICGDCDHFDRSLFSNCRLTLDPTTRTTDASQLPCFIPKDES